VVKKNQSQSILTDILSVSKKTFYPKKRPISSHTAKNRSNFAKNHSHATKKQSVSLKAKPTAFITAQLFQNSKAVHFFKNNMYFNFFKIYPIIFGFSN